MKKYLFVLILLSSMNSLTFAQYKSWGLGLHIGDPLGISVKKYLTERTALEAGIGRTGIWGYNYENAFYRHEQYDHEQYKYRQHRLHSAIAFQVHYIMQQPIPKGSFRGIEWYYGIGGQLRSFAVDYEYRYYAIGQNKKNSTVLDDRLKNINLGIDGVVGLEYSWREVPFSVFADLTLFMEIVDTPLLFYIQGGVGGRYYF